MPLFIHFTITDAAAAAALGVVASVVVMSFTNYSSLYKLGRGIVYVCLCVISFL